jgi:hypothetical protein
MHPDLESFDLEPLVRKVYRNAMHRAFARAIFGLPAVGKVRLPRLTVSSDGFVLGGGKFFGDFGNVARYVVAMERKGGKKAFRAAAGAVLASVDLQWYPKGQAALLQALEV